MVRIALVVLVSAAAGGCGSLDGASAVDRAVVWINSGSGINVSTGYGGGTLGIEGQRERAERELNGWGRPVGGIGAQRDGPPRWHYGSPQSASMAPIHRCESSFTARSSPPMAKLIEF